jgi:hypothetical protein
MSFVTVGRGQQRSPPQAPADVIGNSVLITFDCSGGLKRTCEDGPTQPTGRLNAMSLCRQFVGASHALQRPAYRRHPVYAPFLRLDVRRYRRRP